MLESKVTMKFIRRNPKFKLYMPLLVGLVFGLSISYIFNPNNNEQHCVVVRRSSGAPQATVSAKVSSNKSNPDIVKPKEIKFNYDFRPYFIYSELGFHNEIIAAVIISESRLLDYGVAINNTWLQTFPKVIFFTPYSRSSNFHELYNVNLNLKIIQLPDIMEESSEVEFSFRVLRYLKEHYLNSYKWFMVVKDKAYVNTDNVLSFIKALDSSTDTLVGNPMQYKRNSKNTFTSNNGEVLSSYCVENNGYILSNSLLGKLQHLSMSNFKENEETSVLLAKSIFMSSSTQCVDNAEVKNLFVSPKMVKSLDSTKPLVFYPVASAKQMLEMHQKHLIPLLKKSYDEIHLLQEKIQDYQKHLPDEVPEKTLHWPIGFPPPFKPTSRFEVLQWTYFDENNLYGYSDKEPMSDFDVANLKDKDDILSTVQQAIQRESKRNQNYDYKLLNGYRRLDPQRGAEYVIDLIKNSKNINTVETKRVHLLRPFTKIEALPMPAATEQKGIHLVLPVLKNDLRSYEQFLQMYKRVCLQTGENVVLLTVFINIRSGHFEGEDKEDSFIESKNLIAKYKHSYMWAQLPWLQIGVKKKSDVLVMDIVSMKLPSNALIFLVSLSIDFTTNFMNRCRVNVVSGAQVFFPIPFAEYEPKIVYKTKQKPTFVEVHRNNGFWDESDHTAACFSNRDFKDVRMLQEDFLDEDIQSETKTLLQIFNESKLQVFRSVDSELRKRHTKLDCPVSLNKTTYFACTADAGQRLGSRAQLAQFLFQNERLVS